MRACIFAGSTPQPDCTAIYCLPSTGNDTGTAATPEAVGNSHSTLPVLASNARNMRSLVPPANSKPPPVASTGPQLNDGKLVVHTFLPVSRFQACSSPMWSAPATIVPSEPAPQGAMLQTARRDEKDEWAPSDCRLDSRVGCIAGRGAERLRLSEPQHPAGGRYFARRTHRSPCAPMRGRPGAKARAAGRGG